MRKWFYLLIVAALATACSSPPALTATAPATSAADLPTATSLPTMAVPTPSADLGVVTGQVLVKASGSPLNGHIIYLGNIVPLDPPPAYTITITQEGSPHIAADPEGRFAFSAPPATYALLVWTPFDSKVVADPLDSTKELLVVVTAGEVTDLGTILVEWP